MQTATIIGPKCSAAISTTPVAIGGYSPATSLIYAVVNGIYVANRQNVTLNATVTLWNGSTDYFLAFGTPVAPGDSLYIPGKVELVNGWSVRAYCNVVAGFDAIMFVTEFT